MGPYDRCLPRKRWSIIMAVNPPLTPPSWSTLGPYWRKDRLEQMQSALNTLATAAPNVNNCDCDPVDCCQIATNQSCEAPICQVQCSTPNQGNQTTTNQAQCVTTNQAQCSITNQGQCASSQCAQCSVANQSNQSKSNQGQCVNCNCGA